MAKYKTLKNIFVINHSGEKHIKFINKLNRESQY